MADIRTLSHEPLLQVQALTVSLSGQAIDLVKNISFQIGHESVALVGESGSGKSLTARALMGLLPPACKMQAQKLQLGHQALQDLNESQWNVVRGKRVAMVMQDPKHALNPLHTIGRQVEEPLRLHTRLGRVERQEKVWEMLNAVGLPYPRILSQRYPHQLSGGMGQRVMLAIALINDPELLIADEPTSALDHQMRDQVLQLMKRLVDQRNMGLLLISHDLQQVAQFSERVLVMYQGTLVDQLASEQLAQASHPYTRTLWSCRPSKATRGKSLPVLDRRLLEKLL